jgi:hypothetical protein
MAKQSPFQALVDRQLDNNATEDVEPFEPPTTHAAGRAAARSGDQSLSHRERGKSSNPDYQRLTVYLRRNTILDLKRRIAGTNIELSDIVQDAVDRWIEQSSK